MVLVDAGCEYECYASDITRTWPVNGKFSQGQRLLYEKVLWIQKSLIELVREGTTIERLHHTAGELSTAALVELGIMNTRGAAFDVYGRSTVFHDLVYSFWFRSDGVYFEQSYRRFFPHSIGHHLGMDTHDVLSSLPV